MREGKSECGERVGEGEREWVREKESGLGREWMWEKERLGEREGERAIKSSHRLNITDSFRISYQFYMVST